MKSIYNVPQGELIEKTALKLKKIQSIKTPIWSEFVKTGAHKERAPTRDDWWHVRAAAILRTTYNLGPIGVSKLRSKYGGKKNRGVKPEKFYKGSGKIIRTILQQLEEAGLVKKAEKGIHKGRIIAPKGISLLDKVAAQISGKKPQAMPKPVEVKKEKKATEKVDKEQEEKIIKKPEKLEKKPEPKKQKEEVEKSEQVKEKPKEEKPAVQKIEKVKKKPTKEEKIKLEAGQSKETKKPAEEKKEKVPTAAELAEKAKK